MTDLETQLRDELRTLARQMPVTAVTDAAVRDGRQRRLRRHSYAAVAGAAIVVAAVVVPLGLAGRSGGTPRETPTHRHPAPTVAPLTANYSAWRVAAPQPENLGPGGPPTLAPCSAGEIRSSARTHRTTYGVSGVISLRGRHCAIPISHGPIALLDADGTPLQVTTVTAADQKDPARYPRADLTLAAGLADWGFSWDGSWCGHSAAFVELALDDPDGQTGPTRFLKVPLRGDQLTCGGHSQATLRQGLAGPPGAAVIPAPASWDDLRAGLSVASMSQRGVLSDVRLTLRNVGATSVTLDPCPEYAFSLITHPLLLTRGVRASGGTNLDENDYPLACSGRPLVVPAHGSIVEALQDDSFEPGEKLARHSAVQVTVGIAGLASASAHTTVS